MTTTEHEGLTLRLKNADGIRTVQGSWMFFREQLNGSNRLYLQFCETFRIPSVDAEVVGEALKAMADKRIDQLEEMYAKA